MLLVPQFCGSPTDHNVIYQDDLPPNGGQIDIADRQTHCCEPLFGVFATQKILNVNHLVQTQSAERSAQKNAAKK